MNLQYQVYQGFRDEMFDGIAEEIYSISFFGAQQDFWADLIGKSVSQLTCMYREMEPLWLVTCTYIDSIYSCNTWGDQLAMHLTVRVSDSLITSLVRILARSL